MQKYEIEPLNNFSDEEILADIRSVCKALGKSTILQSDYLRNGKFGVKAIRNHFGNFHGALRKLGLEIKRTGYYSDEELFKLCYQLVKLFYCFNPFVYQLSHLLSMFIL